MRLFIDKEGIGLKHYTETGIYQLAMTWRQFFSIYQLKYWKILFRSMDRVKQTLHFQVGDRLQMEGPNGKQYKLTVIKDEFDNLVGKLDSGQYIELLLDKMTKVKTE